MLRNGCLILSTLALLACSGDNAGGQAGTGGGQGGAGGHAGAGGGQAGAGGGHAGAAGTGGVGGQAGAGGASGGGGSNGKGGAGASGSGGSAGASGAGGAAGQAGGGGAGGVASSELSVNPPSASFPSTLVEATSASQTFAVRNDGGAAATVTALTAAFQGTNAADFLFTANGCGTTLA